MATYAVGVRTWDARLSWAIAAQPSSKQGRLLGHPLEFELPLAWEWGGLQAWWTNQ
jgi:hypothetical protein